MTQVRFNPFSLPGTSPRPIARNAAPRFSGVHPDAAIGIDVPVMNSDKYYDNVRWLAGEISENQENDRFIPKHKNDYKTRWPLSYQVAGKNRDRVLLVAEDWKKGKARPLGELPQPLAGKLAPLVEDQHRFNVDLSKIHFFKPESENKPWEPNMYVRVEYLTKENRSPKMDMLEETGASGKKTTVADIFRKAQKSLVKTISTDQSVAIVREDIDTYGIVDEQGIERTLRRKVDNEQGIWDGSGRPGISFYYNGHLQIRYRHDSNLKSNADKFKNTTKFKRLPQAVQDKIIELDRDFAR